MEEDMGQVVEARLTDWLEMHGHTAEEIVDCIRYIAGPSYQKEVAQRKELAASKVDRPSD